VKRLAKPWPWPAKLLATVLIVISVPKITQVLTAPVHYFTLLWPVTGVSLLLGYFWGRPALAGLLLGALLYNGTSGWQWLSLLPWAGLKRVELADAALLFAFSLTTVAQVALAAWILRRRMPALRDGSLSIPGWISLLLLVGPATCLLKTAVPALLLGWVSLPPHFEKIALAGALWASTTLSVWMAVPIILIFELRRHMPRLAQNPLRNPWITLALVAFPAMALTSYFGLQQVYREQRRFEELGTAFKNEVQAGLDAGEQKLLLLRAFYAATQDASPTRFDQFADDLLASTPSLLGLGWAGPVADAGRAHVETVLTAERGLATPLTESDEHGGLATAPRRDEYWPLLRMAPAARKAMLGFDLASEPSWRQALSGLQNGGAVAQVHAISARIGAEKASDVILYLATADPRGVVIAPLKVDALLQNSLGRQLFEQGHGVSLSGADGAVLAQRQMDPGKDAADPDLAQTYALKLGADSWRLTVRRAKASQLYLSAPLWWFGQALPLLVCVLVGLLLALTASSDRRIFQLERYYAGYVEGLGKGMQAQRIASRHDASIEEAWKERVFEPRFESIVDIRSGEIRGAEALLRWPGAPEGLTTSDIVEWAERKNLIGDVDRNILSSTLHAVAAWPLARLPAFVVSVNVSASELQNPRWAEWVLHELEHHRVAGRNLCVEITEGVLIRADSVVFDQLAALRSAGVRIALDDFGTGYSSIAYLRQLPVDRIKLDRAFVSDLADDDKARRIVASVLALGRTLDIDLVAEGVEDERTAQVLRDLGCTLAQGWYFSPAIGAQAMRDVLGARLAASAVRS
jgi:EAL domain-containing protein (putative c-di-GMP-specific phosphodiesterase class I)